MKYIYILLMITFFGLSKSLAQDCVYPLLFVHGINSSNETWDNTLTVFEPTFGSSVNLEFNLNSDLNSTHYMDDVHWVTQVSSVTSSCIYTINFDTYTGSSSQSASNESAITKQGYAVKLAIDKILEVTGKEKVVIVAHSMGGLASRDYLQRWQLPSESKVAKLVTMGTPHLGANIAQYDLFGVYVDHLSEATRDLSESVNILNLNTLEYDDVPGYYLWGGDESIAQYPSVVVQFFNQDVNCDSTLLSNIIGINEGTTFNPSLPLPNDVKYSYYVGNINHLTCFPNTGGYGCHGDGPVDDMQQWLYQGGSGSTYDFVNGISIPTPLDAIAYRRSDRITSETSIAHIYETSDYENIYRCIDEADFPYYAYKIELDERYDGFSQNRADTVASNSNPVIDGSTSNDPLIDADWYKVDLTSQQSPTYKFTLFKPLDRYIKLDFYKFQTPDSYTNANPSDSDYSMISDESGSLVMELELGNLAPAVYYFRVTSKVVGSEIASYTFKIKNTSIYGCMDPAANNFYPQADIDDGSCAYCDDGIHNGDENGVDCGGANCPVCPLYVNGFDYPVGDEQTCFTCSVPDDGDGWKADPVFDEDDHAGDDWMAESGNECGLNVRAIANATVHFAEYVDNCMGNVVLLRHELENGDTLESMYAHLGTINVSVGNQVFRNNIIGTMGDGLVCATGNDCSGLQCCKVHLELREQNCPVWGEVGTGFTTNTVGWLSPSDYIEQNRPLCDDCNTPEIVGDNILISCESGNETYSVKMDFVGIPGRTYKVYTIPESQTYNNMVSSNGPFYFTGTETFSRNECHCKRRIGSWL